MALNPKFLRIENDSFLIPKKRIAIGIFLALISTVLIYSMLYLFRETFRYMSITEDYDIWILTEKEVKFYNLFYAFLAVIFSQSFFINFVFNIPKRPFAKKNWRKITILNDQRILNLSFINWFAKVTFIFGLIYGFGFKKGYYTFSFYPTYIYLLILVIIVLFLQSFITLRFVFGRKSLKWFAYSAVLITFLSYGLSNLNLVNYDKINKSVLSKNIFSKYRLELPETVVYQKDVRLSLINNIYIVESRIEDDSNKPLIIIDNQEVQLHELKGSITYIQESYSEYERQFINYKLNIHEDIKMEFIYKLKLELASLGLYKVSYAVTPKNRLYNKKYYQNLSFFYRLFPVIDMFGRNLMINSMHMLNSCENIIDIKSDSLNNIFVNSTLTNLSNLKKELKTLVKKNNNYIFKIYVHESNTFSDYFEVITACRLSIQELRNEYSYRHFSCKFDDLNCDEIERVRDMFPEKIIELNKITKALFNIN
jgi:hypothetical protein